MILYSVTTINTKKPDNDRCVAICTTLERAKEIVEHNQCDIWEMEYDLVVIESKETDCVYGGFNTDQYWYEWRGAWDSTGIGAESYVAIDRPMKFKNVSGFGIG